VYKTIPATSKETLVELEIESVDPCVCCACAVEIFSIFEVFFNDTSICYITFVMCMVWLLQYEC